VERRRTATATGLYDSFYHIFFLFTQFLITFMCVSKSLNDEERGDNCLLVSESSYGPEYVVEFVSHFTSEFARSRHYFCRLSVFFSVVSMCCRCGVLSRYLSCCVLLFQLILIQFRTTS